MRIARESNVIEERESSLLRMTDEFVCWSRMQAEAGQELDAIIVRKECERAAGGGLFFWGVGNAPAAITGILASTKHCVRVVFSIMKSRPKLGDIAPARTLLWRSYVGTDKIERPLPEHVIVTSRGGAEPGSKTHHFALMCYSEAPLRIERGTPFDPSAYRNASGNQAPVGASQVTALLRRTGAPVGKPDYEVNMKAWLVGSYWVRLTNPIEMSAEQRAALAAFKCDDDDAWIAFARRLRIGAAAANYLGPQGRLL